MTKPYLVTIEEHQIEQDGFDISGISLIYTHHYEAPFGFTSIVKEVAYPDSYLDNFQDTVYYGIVIYKHNEELDVNLVHHTTRINASNGTIVPVYLN